MTKKYEVEFGAQVIDGRVRFRVWAPRRREVRVAIVDEHGSQLSCHPLQAAAEGFFEGEIADLGAGALYWLLVDEESKRYPDPATRFQPYGVHGPSQVIDWQRYSWQDAEWHGVQLRGQVLYEMHVGAFTAEGTWSAAMERLDFLREVGVTMIEIMPLAEFQGEFGWGYDGVCWYAPTRLYGRPDDFRAFVDAAHALGLGVMLDVVYNHFGPTGNYLSAFSPHFISNRHSTDWGEAINYDGDHCGPVRRFAAANAAHWIREYHLDGLRIDATQAIFDDSPRHVLADITQAAREAAGMRSILVVAENEDQDIKHVRPQAAGGFGMDGVWNDDFHHACRVAATGHAEFYYGDYMGSPQELGSAIKFGYLYQGQWNPRQGRYRGTPTHGVEAANFIHFLQNHDQIANSAKGLPINALTSPGRYRALTALLLLGPQTPMLFMGQEFASSRPFLYFADHEVDVAFLVREGRWEYIRRFPRSASFDQPDSLPDPASRDTFEKSKLRWEECQRHGQILRLHRDLLRLRREDPVFSRQDASIIDGAVIAHEALLLRWFGDNDDDRLLLLNLGRDFHWRPVAEPLMAAPYGAKWRLCWSSEDPKYGGSGAALLDTKDWSIPGHAATVLCPEWHN